MHHDRNEGFRQIAFVAAERKLQRRAAVAALAGVILDDLQVQSASDLANVTDKLGWTTDSPVDLPPELKAALPRFDRAAQHVGQYLALHNAYRKEEALGRAEAEVEALQRSLIAARGRSVSRLLRVANEWRRLLEAERRSLPRATREIPNPFVFGNPVAETPHPVFTGRQDIAQRIEASLLGASQSPTLLLHGPRRMGKTSLLNQLPRLLGPDFAPALVDCQNPAVTGSAATLLRYLSRALAEGLRRRRVMREPLTAAALDREPFAAFDDWLDGVERAMPEGMHALLCLDEYERLQTALDAGWGAPFLDALRHTIQHRPRIALMFTGSHTFAELGPAWTDRFISARAGPGGAPHARRGGAALDPADPRIRHDVCSPELVGGDLRRDARAAVPDAGGRLRAGPAPERAATARRRRPAISRRRSSARWSVAVNISRISGATRASRVGRSSGAGQGRAATRGSRRADLVARA